jgi:preprotein translocase subunit SecF
MFDIIGKKWFYFIFSGLIIVPGIISLVLYGVRPAIDFTGGTLIELRIKNPASSAGRQESEKVTSEIRKAGESQKIEISTIQQSGSDSYLLRLKPIDKDQNQKLQETLRKNLGDVTELSFETVGPSIGQETTNNAIKAVIIASVAIILYISFAFRQVPKPYSSYKFGICAVFALIHDVLVMLGLFSIFGHFFKVEVDTLFITALLTIMGFSVHDTIVVFDRIRENLRKMPGVQFSKVVNESILQTLARSLSTSLTVLLTLFALLLFGGESIHWFVIALLIGITSGTYSSIFNAAPLLVVWDEKARKT